MNRLVLVGAVVGVVLLLSFGTARALSIPALRCQAGKNKVAGKYFQCRQNAEAHRVTSGDMTR